MDIWEDHAVARRMADLAELVAGKPGSAEDKAALDSIMGVEISPDDPRPAPYRKEDHYVIDIMTPEKAKVEGESRMKGQKVLEAVLELSIHDEDNIMDSITHELLENAYDVTHTLAFSTSVPHRRIYEQATGQEPDSSHVDCRKNKIPLSTGIHREDTKHTLLRFPIFIDPITNEPCISKRVISIMKTNLEREPAERRNAYDEIPPRTGKDSIGSLFWALLVNTSLKFTTLYDLNGMNPYQCPIQWGVFYRSHEDPFAVICNTAHSIDVLQTGQHGLHTGHLCLSAQKAIDQFAIEHVPRLTDGTLAENPDTFFAALATPQTRADVQSRIPKPLVYTESLASLSPHSIASGSAYSPSSRDSDLDSDDGVDVRATPSPPETRQTTVERRATAAEVKKQLKEQREKEAKDILKEEYLQRNISILARDEAHYQFSLAYRNAGEAFDPAKSFILQDFRMHQEAFWVASQTRAHVTRSATKVAKLEIAQYGIPADDDDDFDSDEESDSEEASDGEEETEEEEESDGGGDSDTKASVKFKDMEFDLSDEESDGEYTPFSATISLPDGSIDDTPLPLASHTADTSADTSLTASSTLAESQDAVPDTSGLATPTQRSVSLPDGDSPSALPVAIPSPSREPDNSVDVVTEPQSIDAPHPFDYRFPPGNILEAVAGRSHPPTVTPSGAMITRGGVGRGRNRARGHGRGGSNRAAAPSRPAATGSGNITQRGNGTRRGRGQLPTRSSARQAAIEEKKRKAPDSAADKGYEMAEKKRRGE